MNERAPDWLATSSVSANVTIGEEYDLREAARFGNLTWGQFKALPRFERTSVYAHYKAHGLIERAFSIAQAAKR